MDEKVRLEILTTPSQDDGVRIHVEKMVTSKRDLFDFRLKQIPHMEVAINELRNGNFDLIAMGPYQWKNNDVSDLEIVGFLPRREATWVLVSEDKPEYLPFGGKIICDNALLSRQFKRMRRDIEIQTSKEFFEKYSEFKPDIEDHPARINSLEDARIAGLINGYVISRGLFSTIKSKTRRHTLGTQREKPAQEFERSVFIPPPLEGFTMLVGRKGFPKELIEPITDYSAQICYDIENSIFEALDEKLKPICGIYVEQKKLSTILKHYVKLMDESYSLKLGENYLIPGDRRGKKISTKDWELSKSVKPGPRIVIYFELVSPESNVSIEFVRVEPYDDNSFIRGKNVLITEVKFVLDLLQQDHEELTRMVYGLPESYKNARKGLLQL